MENFMISVVLSFITRGRNFDVQDPIPYPRSFMN